MKKTRPGIPLEYALRVKSAELWLEVGQPMEALSEIQKLPQQAHAHPWALEVVQAISQAVYERPPRDLPPVAAPNSPTDVTQTAARKDLTEENPMASFPL